MNHEIHRPSLKNTIALYEVFVFLRKGCAKHIVLLFNYLNFIGRKGNKRLCISGLYYIET